ncbi:hypothetical protein GCM10007421_38100 [Halopseudomonas oceani]|nr:hypothetical protein GCM10007421_38100 [Halopseudomonas oceani]
MTHITSLGIDCIWTKDEQGRLVTEASGPYGSGVCWHTNAVSEATSLNDQGMLAWHEAPVFDHEYGNKNKCYYEVDKKNGIARLLFGDDISDREAEECRQPESEAQAIALASPMDKKVEFGGYVARKSDLLGALVLACYTGSLDTNNSTVSENERVRRYSALLDLYGDDRNSAARVTKAFEFASVNLRDRFPLDTMGRYRVAVCDQMAISGKF